MNVEVSLVLQLLFVSRTLKNVFVGIFRDAARCKWAKVAVMVWAEDGSSLKSHHQVKIFSIFSKHKNQTSHKIQMCHKNL